MSPSTCNPQRIIYEKNPHYWQKGKPKIDQVVYPAYTDNPPANLDLATGQDQWGGQFIPNIKTYYSAKSKDNHYWFPPVANVSIFINLKNPILKNVAVRRAMAYAINRPHVAKLGESGYEPPGSQTGIVSPTFKSWQSKKLAKQITYNPKKAKQILTKAGFKLKNGVFQTKSGKPLSFTMINISGYTDWIQSASIVQDELKAIGIKVTPRTFPAMRTTTRPSTATTSSRTTATRPAGRAPTTRCGRSSIRRTPRRSGSRRPRTGSATTTRRPTS